MLQVGDKAPDIAVNGTGGATVKLSDFAGKIVVLYFYPKDNTPGCTMEAMDFRDAEEDFASLGAVVLGVSKDTVKCHEGFQEKHNLPFQLLSDPDAELQRAFDVWKPKKMMGKEFMGTIRSTFVLDREGHVVQEWRSVKVEGHVDEVLGWIRENMK